MYTLIGQYVVYIGCSAFHGNGFFHQILFRRGKHPAERERLQIEIENIITQQFTR